MVFFLKRNYEEPYQAIEVEGLSRDLIYQDIIYLHPVAITLIGMPYISMI
jgi:hypothetical protein